MRFIIVMLAVLTAVFAAPQARAQAQLLSGASSGEARSDPQGALAEALKEAAGAGLSVVVIDTAGNVIAAPQAGVAQSADGTAAEGDAGHSASPLMQAQAQVDTFRSTLRDRLQALPNSLIEVAFILRATSPDGRIMTYVEALFWTLLLFVAGRFFTTEVYGKRIARRFVVSRIKSDPQGYSEKMPFLVFRFFMGIIGTLVTMVFAYAAGSLIFGSVDDLSLQFTITAIYTTFFACRVVADLWRMILSPFLTQYRIPRFSDRDALRLYRWAIVLASLDISFLVFATWLNDFGLNYNVYAIMFGALTLLTTILNIAMIGFNGRAISSAIRNGRRPEEVSGLIRFLSYAWAPAVIVYFVFGWLKLAFDLVLEAPTSIPLIAGLYGVLASIIVVYGVINYFIERFFARSRALRDMNAADAVPAQGETEGEDAATASAAPAGIRPQQPITTYEELARRVSGILAFVAGTMMTVQIWDGGELLADGTVPDRALDVVIILFIGYVIYHAFRIWIDSKIAEEGGDAPEGELGDEGGANSASRLATLLPLFRNVILIVVVVTIGLIALLEVGINVSPLFAGAGVVGLAVGFGAQALVRDIFSGAFFLFDDAFRKGEYIDIGSVKGTVEKISVRSLQLRHHLGALHTIPFGEIQVLSNYSRDWVIMKLKLRLTYDTDVERVRKLVKNLGQDLLNDPVIGDNFIQPLKSQGVIEMQDSAMIVRVKFMTKPGDQWLVRKKVYEEIRAMFEREGIKFAHREVTVRLADEPKAPLSDAQKEAITAAAEAAIDEDMMEGGPSGGDDR
ncbi:MAG: mechanosensitive ion channel family protein [Rhodobacteraceae bacterium]|nr:mechanosensitive ion channel family protein [Paracoccaceae bacterium]